MKLRIFAYSTEEMMVLLGSSAQHKLKVETEYDFSDSILYVENDDIELLKRFVKDNHETIFGKPYYDERDIYELIM